MFIFVKLPAIVASSKIVFLVLELQSSENATNRLQVDSTVSKLTPTEGSSLLRRTAARNANFTSTAVDSPLSTSHLYII